MAPCRRSPLTFRCVARNIRPCRPRQEATMRAIRGFGAFSFALLGVASCAWAASSVSYTVTVNGATVGSDSKTYSSGSAGSLTFTQDGNNYDSRVDGRVWPANAGGFAQVTSSAPAQASVTARSDSSFVLRAPGSFSKVAGGRLVLFLKLEGNITGNATLVGDISVKLLTDVSLVTNTAHQSLSNQPGPDTGGFEISLPLDANLPTDAFVQVSPSLTLTASASVPGGSLQTATIDANNTLKVAGFRVFNAGGVQVTGFAFSPGTYIPELLPLPLGVVRAIEYYNPSYGFFFITATAQEISDLDSGKTPGWQRTGESFNVYTTSGAGLVGVCRFFGVFGPKSSHFYAPRGLGCEALLPNNPVWQYEGEAFYTYLPNVNGDCPTGNDPVFRLYNNGQGGAPNHRFTTSASIQVQMLGEGWIAEGSGSGVGMCSPQQ